MITPETVYDMEMYLENLLMYKMIHDEGFDLSKFHSYELSTHYSFSGDDNHHHFLNIASYIFEIFESYDSYGEDIDDKKYWLELGKPKHILNTEDCVMVILDSNLNNPVTGLTCGSVHWDNCAEISQIDGGVIIYYDSDYGSINYVDILRTLLASRRRTIESEEKKHEMAI